MKDCSERVMPLQPVTAGMKYILDLGLVGRVPEFGYSSCILNYIRHYRALIRAAILGESHDNIPN